MYINKEWYNLLKVISAIGNILWSFLGFTMIFGLSLKLARGDDLNTDTLSVTIFCCVMWIAHFVLRIWVERVKVYNGIFANDADGILQTKVIARALGIEESRVVSEINILCRLQLLKNCTVQWEDSQNVVILSNEEGVNLSYTQQLQTVICPHCGGKNHIRRGFVQSCQFCSGKLNEGRVKDVSE